MRILIISIFLTIGFAHLAPLLHGDSPHIIPGKYIVVLKDGLTVIHRDDHVQFLKINITGSGSFVSSLFNIGKMVGFSAHLSPIFVLKERLHPQVKYVEADQVMSINYQFSPLPQLPQALRPISLASDTQLDVTWGLDRIDQRDLPLDGSYTYNSSAGAGVDVYIIDTGILTTHVEFGGRATFAFTAVPLEENTDLNGHGTHCAGTIGGATYGVAKAAHLIAVKVLSKDGSGSTQGVIDGINYVTNYRNISRKTVASMSLGGGASTTLDMAVNQSIASGVVFSIAAGNDGGDACNGSPARVPGGIKVGAINKNDTRATFSNFGSCVSIFAPGVSITSAWIGNDNATNTISGTSMATPHVSGVLALHLSYDSTLSPEASKEWLLSVATPDLVVNASTTPNYLLYAPHD